jgi:hypothetical protein
MVRRFTGYLLIIALVSTNFSSLFVYAGFELNRDFIAKNLCINRDKPWLHCNGKCYFMRKIKQAQEKEKSQERQSQKNLFQEACFTQKAGIRFYPLVLQVMQVPHHRIALPIAHLSIFQPPQIG